jgi:hypothetical protein
MFELLDYLRNNWSVRGSTEVRDTGHMGSVRYCRVMECTGTTQYRTGDGHMSGACVFKSGMRRRHRRRVLTFAYLWPFFLGRSGGHWVTPRLGEVIQVLDGQLGPYFE